MPTKNLGLTAIFIQAKDLTIRSFRYVIDCTGNMQVTHKYRTINIRINTTGNTTGDVTAPKLKQLINPYYR